MAAALPTGSDNAVADAKRQASNLPLKASCFVHVTMPAVFYTGYHTKVIALLCGALGILLQAGRSEHACIWLPPVCPAAVS